MLGPLAVARAINSWLTDERPASRVLARSVGDDLWTVDVLVSFGGSAESGAALSTAVVLMGTSLARLTLATVVPFDGGSEAGQSAVAALKHETERVAWLAPGIEVLRGHPATALAARAPRTEDTINERQASATRHSTTPRTRDVGLAPMSHPPQTSSGRPACSG